MVAINSNIQLAPVPAGYVPAIRNLPQAMVQKAQEILHKQKYGYGELVHHSDGVTYFLRVEQHKDNHPDPSREPFVHPGVTVYAPANVVNAPSLKSKIDKYPTSINTPPEGIGEELDYDVGGDYPTPPFSIQRLTDEIDDLFK